MDAASAGIHLREALIADPAYLPAYLQLIGLNFLDTHRSEHDFLLERTEAVVDPELRGCLRAIVYLQRGRFDPQPRPAQVVTASGACHAVFWAHAGRTKDVALSAEHACDAWQVWTESPALTEVCLTMLQYAGDFTRVLDWSKRLSDERQHPLTRAVALGFRAAALHALGREAKAVALEAESARFAEREEPGVRRAYLSMIVSTHRWLIERRLGDSKHAQVISDSASVVVAALERSTGDGRLGGRVNEAQRLLDTGDLTRSLASWDSVLEVARSRGNKDVLTWVLVRRGRTLSKLGRNEEAERDLIASRDFARAIDYPNWEAEAEHNLLHLYETLDRPDAAEKAGRAFVSLAALHSYTSVLLMSHHDLGLFYMRRGDLEKARPQFMAMIETADSIGNNHYWAGEYFEMIGDLERAAYYYRLSWPNEYEPYQGLAGLVRVAEATGDVETATRYAQIHDDEIWLQRNPESIPLLPGIYARNGHASAAIVELERGRARAHERGQVASWATLSLQLAELELERDNHQRALLLADSARGVAASVAAWETGVQAEAVSTLARLRAEPRANGQATEATLERLLARAETTGGFPLLRTKLLETSAAAMLELGRVEDAFERLTSAAVIADSVARSLSTDHDRAGFRAAQHRVSDRALAVVLERSTVKEAVDRFASWSVWRKARGVLEATRNPSAGPPSRSATRLLLSRLQSSLGPEHAIVDYAVLGSRVGALVITSKEQQLVALPIAADTLRALVRELFRKMDTRIGGALDMQRAVFDVGIASVLYQSLLAPLADVLGGHTRVTIVPDGILHVVPFDALVVSPEAARAPRYVVDEYVVSLVPSLSLAPTQESRLQPGSLVAVAGEGAVPPPGAAQELKAIRRALGSHQLLMLTGADAVESAVRAHAGSAALLHFAAHALPNPREPLLAQIQLNPAGNDDGALHAHEIAGLELRGSIVVLSGCETATGRLLDVEGPMSLSRAFLRAGAGTTVATLWPIGENATSFMEPFYRALAEGRTAAEALRHARLTLRAQGYSSPLYWAPFTLMSMSS
jgi:CHAT domain-containing protein/tetratricopeptide (TPR) repeat protein